MSVKRTIVVLALAALLAPALSCSNRWSTTPLPPLLRTPSPTMHAGHDPGKVVHFQAWAWPHDPAPTVQLAVINSSPEPFTFDVRPLTTLAGLEVHGTDTKGKQHKIVLGQVCTPRSSVFDVDFSKGAVSAGLETVTLKPGESFSWPARFWRRDWAVLTREIRGRPVVMKHYRAILTLKDGTKLESNTFPEQRQKERRLPQKGRCPRDVFLPRLDALRWHNPRDVGVRLASLRSFAEMGRRGVLSGEQFAQVLTWAARDKSPLVRADAALFDPTWRLLLLDPEPVVRRVALEAAGGRRAQSGQTELTPALLAMAQMGDTDTRCLAFVALHKHAGNPHYEQVRDTVLRAANDPDPKVRKTVRARFTYWLKHLKSP